MKIVSEVKDSNELEQMKSVMKIFVVNSRIKKLGALAFEMSKNN